MSALDTQIGGNHYRRWKIQPVEFWMRNKWDACSGSALKYICRHDAKDGVEALRKARHFMQLRVDLYDTTDLPPERVIRMSTFIETNGIDPLEAAVLRELDAWVMSGLKVRPTFFPILESLKLVRYGLSE